VTGWSLSELSRRALITTTLGTTRLPQSNHIDRLANLVGVNRETFAGDLPHFVAAIETAKRTGWIDAFKAPRPSGIRYRVHPRFGTKIKNYAPEKRGDPWPSWLPIHHPRNPGR
jgi:hypothetical protein